MQAHLVTSGFHFKLDSSRVCVGRYVCAYVYMRACVSVHACMLVQSYVPELFMFDSLHADCQRDTFYYSFD